MVERGGRVKAASTGDGKHAETEIIRPCLLADGVARRPRSWLAASVMFMSLCTYVCMYVCV